MEVYRNRYWVRTIVSLPFIWFLIIPLVFIDFCAEIYHRLCFPLYGIPYVKRGDYICIDRHKLSYLAWYQKLGCIYCGYGNGLLRYLVEMAGRTEKYWCGIMHKNGGNFLTQDHQKDFLPYGDEQAFQDFMKK